MPDRLMRVIGAVGAVIIALTVLVGVHLLITERNWFFLVAGLWAALAAGVIVRDHRRGPEDRPADED
jgi:hypothetical protein